MFGAMVEVQEASKPPSLTTAASPLPKSSSISTTTFKQGGNKFISKFFGKQSTTPKEDLHFQIPDMHDLSPELAGLINPCPFIRPLGHKLEARSEPRARIKPFSVATTSTGNSYRKIAMNREEASRMLSGRDSVDEMKESVADLSTIEQEEDDGYEEDIDVQISQQQEYVAVVSAHDSEAVHHWRYYIECYSKGQFNLIHPPLPPPRSFNFEYLPAIFPYHEATRLSVGSSFDRLWPQWSQEKAGALIRSAMKKFDSYYASLSFFDSKYELFKAENGFNASHVCRAVSIAAHALLSADVLVVLDTKKDWRFEANPLVNGSPGIRFYAGAPMLSPDGHAVGVFSIFGKEPRTSFTPAQRRELAEFGFLAMSDLSLQAEWLSDPELRATPLLERDSVINGYQPPSTVPSSIVEEREVDPNLVPPALRYHKVKTPVIEPSRVFIHPRPSPAVLSEQTPPSSSGGSVEDHAGTLMSSPRGFGKNHKDLSVDSNLNHLLSYPDLITPDSGGFIASSPRPFSSSDITSLNPQPPNTPVPVGHDESSFHLTVENFMSLSDDDCAEEPSDSSPSDLASPKEELDKTKKKSRKDIPPLTLPSSRFTTSSISTAMSGQSHESGNPMTDAAFACSHSAQSLGYDLIYVVEINPARQFMTDQELHAEGGLKKHILVAYGLNRPMELSSEIHIRILRCRGYESWENSRASYESGEYESGLLVPISSQGGPRKYRSSGLIFGAFRRPKLVGVDGEVRNPAADLARLLDAAMVLKKILGKIYRPPPPARRPKRSNTEPATSNRYPANEAVEVSNSSLEAIITELHE